MAKKTSAIKFQVCPVRSIDVLAKVDAKLSVYFLLM